MTTKLYFKTISPNGKTNVAYLSLNRPDAANSMNQQMIKELQQALDQVAKNKDCRALVLQGEGKHFCAGADLTWMKASAKLNLKQNIADAAKLAKMLETIANLPIPTIGVAHGSVYGGAVGLIAACDYAIAIEKTNFCISEVKLGLVPAMILPYLARKILPGQLRRLSLSAKVFLSEEALSYGLVEIVTDQSSLNAVLRDELNRLLACGPLAQAALQKLFSEVRKKQLQQGSYTQTVIAKVRTGKEAQAGMQAFFDKQNAPWKLKP